MESKTFNNLSNVITIVLAFLMPLFFLPVTTEFFEFNKQVLLIAATLLLLIAWVFKVAESNSISITKSVLDLPLILFLIVVILSTVFSINKTTSIFGGTGRWFPSLLGYVSLTAFYYLVSSGIEELNIVKKIMSAFIFSSLVSSLVSILSYYNIFLGNADYFKISNFTLSGSVTTTSLIAGLALIMAVGIIIYQRSSFKKILLTISIAVNFLFICLTNLPSTWIVLGVGVFAFLTIVKPSTIAREKSGLFVIFGIILATFLAVNLLDTKEILINKDYTQELKLPIKESWEIASSIIKDYPLLATGPSTFYLNFSRYRPLALNVQDIWDVRFDKPYNEVFNIISDLGILGLCVLVIFGVQMYKLFRAGDYAKEATGVVKVLTVVTMAASSMFLVTHATVLNSFIMFLFLALLVNTLQLDKQTTKFTQTITIKLTRTGVVTLLRGEEVQAEKSGYLKYILIIPSIALVLYMGYLTVRNYQGEVYVRSSLIAAVNNEWKKVYDFQEKAIKVNPQRDTYYNRHAQTTLALANSIASKGQLTEDDKTVIQALLIKAIQSAKVSTEIVNPSNVRNWEVRAFIYKSIAGVTADALDWSIAAYNVAVNLDPTNPKLRVDLGGAYYAKGDYTSAANQFRQAFNLKPDYANAYYNFGQALLKAEDYQNARIALEKARSLVSRDSLDYKKVSEEIASIPIKPGEETQAQKPTVEELAKTTKANKENTGIKQEPISVVGEEENIQTQSLEEGILPVEKSQE